MCPRCAAPSCRDMSVWCVVACTIKATDEEPVPLCPLLWPVARQVREDKVASLSVSRGQPSYHQRKLHLYIYDFPSSAQRCFVLLCAIRTALRQVLVTFIDTCVLCEDGRFVLVLFSVNTVGCDVYCMHKDLLVWISVSTLLLPVITPLLHPTSLHGKHVKHLDCFKFQVVGADACANDHMACGGQEMSNTHTYHRTHFCVCLFNRKSCGIRI